MRTRYMSQAVWAFRYVAELGRMGSCADASLMAERGSVLWEAHDERTPEEAALAELVLWEPIQDPIQ